MKYKILQMKLTDEQAIAISNLEENQPMPEFYQIYCDANMYPNKEKIETAMNAGMYDHVANIEADDLNSVFHIGNLESSEKVEYIDNKFGRNMHSITVGDIVEDPEGKRYFVDFSGFGEL